jgi:superfamily II DNA or RNA helicase
MDKDEQAELFTPIQSPKLPKRVQALSTAIPVDYNYISSYINGFMAHQSESLKALKNNTIGQVSLPTGTGKTRVQIGIHLTKMQELHKAGKSGVFVIGAHRLALCSQLMDEMLEIVVNTGIPFDVLTIGSHTYDRENVDKLNSSLNRHTSNVTSTLNSQEVLNAYEKAIANGRMLICVSTYHSFNRLHLIPNIDICTYDEAHTLVTDAVESRFLDNISLIQPKINFNFFFTATRKVQGLNEGMNNVERFGELLIEIPPKRMVEDGVIIPPKIHRLNAVEFGDYTNDTMYIKSVIEGYKKHKEFVQSHCNWLGSKLLISTNGNQQMFVLHNAETFINFCKSNKIEVFAFSSQEGCYHNFEKKSRSYVMAQMDSLDDEVDAILLHIDILTEGIDLPSITGVMPFRELNDIKLLQTIGRGTRLLKNDRERLINKEIKPTKFDTYHKPYCWVIFPEYLSTTGNVKAMTDTIHLIMDQYEVPVTELVVNDSYLAQKVESLDSITESVTINRRDDESDIIHIVEDVWVEKMSHFSLSNIISKLKGKT